LEKSMARLSTLNPGASGLAGKRVLITGAASGLGLGCAARFATLGADILIADVNVAAARAACESVRACNPVVSVDFLEIDLANLEATARAADNLVQRGQPIDILVNNAGIYPPSQRVLAACGHELTFTIAYLGHVVLTNRLWPLLEAASAARVITISSLVQRYAKMHMDDLALAQRYQPITAYRQAKLACLLFAVELQRRLTVCSSRVRSYAAHPGVCRTQIGRNRLIQASDGPLQRLSSWAMAWGLRHFGQTPEESAASVLLAAISDTIAPGSFVGPRGFLEMGGRPGVAPLGRVARDTVVARELWERTQAITGVRWPF
jgi:NAD(P)-dependent dehydrogenase (short-subunit alcohol dehydrogenase family)